MASNISDFINDKYILFDKQISGPFTIPSGIITTEAKTLEKIAEVPEIGILTTKSIGLEPREGNREPIIAQYEPFSFINAVGLANPGVDEFSKQLSSIYIPDDKFLLASIFGSSEYEFLYIANMLFDTVDGFELNISCPHSDKFGQTIGQDNELVRKIVKKVSLLGKPTLVKLSPNLDIAESARSALDGGANGFTAINTKGPEVYKYNGHIVLSNKKGGVSGKAIKSVGLECIQELRLVTTTPIIACGGIQTAPDILDYRKAGADFYGLGSALAGMDTEILSDYFYVLLQDCKANRNTASSLLDDTLNMNYVRKSVKKKENLAEDLFTLEFENSINATPGQFIFAWLPEKGEKPFSVMNDDPLTLLIQKRGYLTEELSKLEKGDEVYIRGPYGKTPDIFGKGLLVGGGTGIAALYLFAKYDNAIPVLGAKDKAHLAFLDKFESISDEVYTYTEDGSFGKEGLVTQDLDKVIKSVNPDYVLNCGPEPMVRAVIEKEIMQVPLENIYSSIDYMTKCGIGLCGRCATSRGYRSCVDGTFLEIEKI